MPIYWSFYRRKELHLLLKVINNYLPFAVAEDNMKSPKGHTIIMMPLILNIILININLCTGIHWNTMMPLILSITSPAFSHCQCDPLYWRKVGIGEKYAAVTIQDFDVSYPDIESCDNEDAVVACLIPMTAIYICRFKEWGWGENESTMFFSLKKQLQFNKLPTKRNPIFLSPSKINNGAMRTHHVWNA